MQDPALDDAATAPPGRIRRHLKAAGKVGFWFFFLKGLAWLIVPALIAAGLWTG